MELIKKLPDDYPIYADYLYIIDNNEVIKSDIYGTVLDLKRDLMRQGIKTNNVYTATILFEQKEK